MKAEKITGIIAGFVLGILSATILLGFPFGFGVRILDSLYFIYADLYRDCGDWCYRATLVGWILLIIYFVLFGLLTAFIIKKVLTRFNLPAVVRAFLVIVLLPILSGILTPVITLAGNYIPPLPISIRCASVINSPETFGDFVFGPDSGRAGCAFQLAKRDEDSSWCAKIDDQISRSMCVGYIARETNNPSLCNTTDVPIRKDRCLDKTIEDNQPIQTDTPKMENAPQVFDLSGFEGFYGGPHPRTNYYPEADIESQPKELWNMGFGYSETPSLAIGPYLITQHHTKSSAGLALYDGSTGKIKWTLRGNDVEGYHSSIKGMALSNNILVYYDWDDIFIHNVATGSELWQKEIDVAGDPIIFDETVYVLHQGSKSTGASTTLSALDLMSGDEQWSVALGQSMYMKDYIVATPDSIFLTARSTHAPLTAHIYVIDRQTGEYQEISKVLGENGEDNPKPVSRKKLSNPVSSQLNSVERPVYAEGLLYVRTGDGILVIDEETAEIVKEWSDPFDYTKESVWKSTAKRMAYHDGTLYYTTDEKTLVAWDVETEEYRWETKIDNELHKAAIVSDQYLYTATESELIAIDRMKGDIVWEYELITPIRFDPQIAEGRIYFFTTPHRLYALGKSEK